MRRLLGGLLATTLLFAGSAQAATPPGDILLSCKYTHSANDDPIVFFGQPGASHRHDFSGGRVSAFSTFASLRASTSSCAAVPQDDSGYWFMAIQAPNGSYVPYTHMSIYLRANQRTVTIRRFGDGLKHVQGDHHNTSINLSAMRYRCVPAGTYGTYWPKACPVGSTAIEASLYFPSCWNGQLDNPTHKTLGACGPAFPIQVPALQTFAMYPMTALGGRPVCDSPAFPGRWGLCGHGDFLNAWDPVFLQRLVDQCLNIKRSCRFQNGRVYNVAVSPPALVPGF